MSKPNDSVTAQHPVHHRFIALSATVASMWGRRSERLGFLVRLAAFMLLTSAACHREANRSDSFVQSLRCGMTHAEVRRLAREHGYNTSDPSWLTRSAGDQSRKSKELSFLDLTFRRERLVAFREGRYAPGTKRVEYRNVDLCRAAVP